MELTPFDFLDRLADLVPPPLAPARGPPTGWAELLQVHDDRDAIQASAGLASPDELPVIDIHSR